MTVEQCPICHGTGHVDAGFYLRTGPTWSSTGGIEKCQSCDGKGYVVVKYTPSGYEELARVATEIGNGAHVLVPRKWVKKRVKVIRMEE